MEAGMRSIYAVVGAVLAGAVPTAQFDMAAIQKWNAARIVHYEVTGVYRATVRVAKLTVDADAEAQDRVTLSFDCDLRGSKPVSPIKFTNTATTLSKVSSGKAQCPPPALKGAYEHFDVVSVAENPAGIEMKGTRSFPASDVSPEWPTTCATKPSPAAQAQASEIMAVVSPMMLVMPSGANPNMTVAADKKSYTVKAAGGWSWTYTPTVVP
jgi:hypothetical protein